jgi:hypothetical protein
MTSADIKRLWQDEALGSVPPDIESVQERSAAFFRTIVRRNRIEYTAAAVVVLALGIQMWFETSPVVRTGELFLMAAAIYVVWQLRLRASPKAAPIAPTLPEAIDHLRAEFARQRDALLHVWDWYMLPFVPGFALVFVGRAVGSAAWLSLGWVATVVIVLVFAFVWRVNRTAARKLVTAIDDLDAMERELEC